jgi:hypothetical protein
MQYIWEMGLMKYWQRKSTPRVEKCLMESKERPKITRLKMVDLYSAFLLLAAGTALSIMVFIAENFARNKKSFARPMANNRKVGLVFD